MSNEFSHILLFPGSFSPMHIGHLALGNYIIESCPEVDQLWYSVTPESPYKQGNVRLPQEFRIRWAEHLLGMHPRMCLSYAEQQLPTPTYTYNTLLHLRKAHPQFRVSLLMGADSWLGFKGWYKWNEILSSTTLYIYPRPDYPIQEPLPQGVKYLAEAPLFQVSSTQITRLIASGASIPYLLATPPPRPSSKNSPPSSKTDAPK